MSDEERLARRAGVVEDRPSLLLLDRNLAKEAWFDVPWVRLDQHGVAYPVGGDDGEGGIEAVTGHRAVALQAREGWRLSFQSGALPGTIVASTAVLAHAHGTDLEPGFPEETRLAIIVRGGSSGSGHGRPGEHVDAWVMHPGTRLDRPGDGTTEIMGWPTAVPRPPARHEPVRVGVARLDDELHMVSAGPFGMLPVLVTPARLL